MAKPKVHPDVLHSRRMEARFVAALLLGVGAGALLVGWYADHFLLLAAGVILAATGAAWPRLNQAWLERRAAGGTRCLQCGMRIPAGSGFCQECGWRVGH